MNLKISPVIDKTVEVLAELLGEYQTFYGASPNYVHNLKFLQNFLEGREGVFFLCTEGEHNVGYVGIYFSYSSVSAKRIAILNDLYVREDFRNRGVGKELIDYVINYAEKIGIEHIRWCTRINNDQAQALYSKYESTKTGWFQYDLDVSLYKT